jgi:DNA-nicking Smr family endonuclease
MARRLSAEERALWNKVVATVRSYSGAPAAPEPPMPEPSPAAPALATPAPRPKSIPAHAPIPGETLDGSWDRRLGRGLVQPDVTVDLHGHNLATAYRILDERLESAIARGARVMLLVTGKPPTDDRRPVARGAIRAAIGDWLGASRHAAGIAAVRNAHPRHGGLGALYIVLRRKRG